MSNDITFDPPVVPLSTEEKMVRFGHTQHKRYKTMVVTVLGVRQMARMARIWEDENGWDMTKLHPVSDIDYFPEASNKLNQLDELPPS